MISGLESKNKQTNKVKEEKTSVEKGDLRILQSVITQIFKLLFVIKLLILFIYIKFNHLYYLFIMIQFFFSKYLNHIIILLFLFLIIYF